MNIKKFLSNLDVLINPKDLDLLQKEVSQFVNLLKTELSKSNLCAQVFVGGSFAKKTLPKAKAYDADIFVRFPQSQKDLSDNLEKVLNKISKNKNLQLQRIHGSRDYFNLPISKQLTLEIIPVLKIGSVAQAQNITDLSYFHVAYARRKLTERMRREVALAKRFCASSGIYGAESYIRGFSGYGLECLIIYYKNFERMLRDLIKVGDEKKIIDIEKTYKKREDVLVAINESKTQGPVILIDPTWKERNVLASLSIETFRIFQKKAREFLEHPSEKYFYERAIDCDALKTEAKKKKEEFLYIVLETDKQEGDIAGTKMKKFSGVLVREVEKYFEVKKTEFDYSGGKSANSYLVVKQKKEIVKFGPPVKMKKEAQKFRDKNKNVFEKNGKLCARVKIDFSAREFLEKWKKSSSGKKTMRDMSIVGIKVVD